MVVDTQNLFSKTTKNSQINRINGMFEINLLNKRDYAVTTLAMYYK